MRGADGGKLFGKTFALKDPIRVAGVPSMSGSALMEGYIPDCDATVVTRILDAGGEIIGKAVCEDLCISGSGAVGLKATYGLVPYTGIFPVENTLDHGAPSRARSSTARSSRRSSPAAIRSTHASGATASG